MIEEREDVSAVSVALVKHIKDVDLEVDIDVGSNEAENDEIDSLTMGIVLSEDQDLEPYLEDTKALKKLSSWFSRLKPARVDLISHLGGATDMFLIHVESLILRLVYDHSIRADFLEEGQCLKLSYLIESFLDSLLRCGAQYRLIFMDCFGAMFAEERSIIWTFRQAFLLRCKTSKVHGLQYQRFANWWDPAFANFVEESLPPFILLEDFSEFEDVPMKYFPLCFMLKCSGVHLNVALMSDLLFKGHKVHCFAIPPPLYSLNKLIKEVDEVVLADAKDYNESSPAGALAIIAESLTKFQNGCPKSNHIGLREFLICLSLQDDLMSVPDEEMNKHERDSDIFLTKMLLITSFMERHLSLEDRALKRIDMQSLDLWEYGSTLTILGDYCVIRIEQWLTALSHDEASSLLAKINTLQPLDKDLADLFDLRLFYIVFLLTAQFAEDLISNEQHLPLNCWGLPEGALKEISYLLETVGGLTKEEASMDDLNHFDLRSKVECSHNGILSGDSKPHEFNFMNLQSSFMTKVLEQNAARDALPPTKDIEPSLDLSLIYGDENRNGQDNSLIRGFVFDWAQHEIATHAANNSVSGFVDEERIKNYKGNKEMFRKLQEMKIRQRGAHRIHKYLSSLVAPGAYGQAIRVSRPGAHIWELNAEAEGKSLTEAEGRGETTTSKRKQGAGAKKAEAEKTLKKPSTKAEAIIKANIVAQMKKTEDLDAERLPNIMSNLSVVASRSSTPTLLLNRLLDVVVGNIRLTEELGTLAGITSFLKLPGSHLKVFARISEILYKALSKQFAKLDDTATSDEAQALHKLQCFSFQFCHTYARMYKSEMKAEDVIPIQRLLICVGFVNSAKSLYDEWVSAREKQYLKELQTEAAALDLPVSKGKVKGGKPAAVANKGLSKTKQNHELRNFSAGLRSALVDPASVDLSAHRVPAGLEAEVQLKFMGHLMDRSLGSTPDPRVGFYPDAWQKRLLNVVDQRRSALVCAPTGCGKTFACFYAMEKVITLDNTSVVVFVCPSKALAHQVSFEVQARFRSKEFPVGCSTALNSLAMKEYAEKIPTEAQILITLPSLLERYLMSPKLIDWVHRLKYVILDEIHCIGEGEEEGQAWERLVQLMPCPFLALSATVGNPTSFYRWLINAHISSEEQRKDKKVPIEVITFGERYADLSCYIFQSPDTVVASKTTYNPKMNSALYPLNPFLCLSFHSLRSKPLSSDFYVPSNDLLRTYQILREVLMQQYPPSRLATLTPAARNEVEAFCNAMHPSKYFKQCRAITKRQYRYFLQWFKESFSYMIAAEVITEEILLKTQKYLMSVKPITSPDEVLIGTLWDPKFDAEVDEVVKEQAQVPTGEDIGLAGVLRTEDVKNTFLDIAKVYSFAKLMQKLMLLPALVFSLDRAAVTYLGSGFITYLEQMQHNKYYGSPAATAATKALNKKRMDEFKARMKMRDELMKLKSLSKEQREDQGISAELERELSQPPPVPPVDIATELDPEFSFASRRAWGTHHDEIIDIIKDAQSKRQGNRSDTLFCQGLLRGIAYHHSGLNRRKRTAVERLFRLGYLGLVFATETLSMGVNVPCKSTVFLGDNLTLTPMTYRQTSGRAGRRGYDVLGHIVFWDMPFSKLKRLMCAPLPVLSGEFPVSPTTVLRCYYLLNGVKEEHKKRLENGLAVKASEIERQALKFLKDTETFENSLLRLFKTPLFSVSSVDGESRIDDANNLTVAVQFAFRFAADFLQRSCLLNTKANCDGFAGVISLLYENEPGNVALNWILCSGILHQLEHSQDLSFPQLTTQSTLEIERLLKMHRTNAGDPAPPAKVLQLISILALCLVRMPLCQNVSQRMSLEKDFDPLIPMPSSGCLEILERERKEALTNAIEYVKALASLRSKNDLVNLPVSQTRFSFDSSIDEKLGKTPLTERLQDLKIESNVRSPFASINGRSDNDFLSATELCYSKPHKVHLEESLIPELPMRTVTVNGKPRLLLSNFIVKFLLTTDLSKTAKETCINPNDLYYMLASMKDCLNYLQVYFGSARVEGTVVSKETLSLLQIIEDAFTLVEASLKKIAA